MENYRDTAPHMQGWEMTSEVTSKGDSGSLRLRGNWGAGSVGGEQLATQGGYLTRVMFPPDPSCVAHAVGESSNHELMRVTLAKLPALGIAIVFARIITFYHKYEKGMF